MCNIRTRKRYRAKSHDQVYIITNQLHLKKAINDPSFKFIPQRVNAFCQFTTIILKKKCNKTEVCYHGTIMRTGITCKKTPLQKSIEFSMALK